MFLLMSSLRDEAIISQLLRMELAPEEELPEVNKKAAKRLVATGSFNDPTPQPAAPKPKAPRRPSAGVEAAAAAAKMGVGRNDPCPCGSGRKFKKCCQGAVEAPASPA